MPRRLLALLYVATFVSGTVDAVSFLALGRVFVANMTGNIVLLGFAIASAPGISAVRSSVALVAFLLGSAAGGALAHFLEGSGRRRWLLVAFGCETACFAIALGLAAAGVVATASDNGEVALIVPLGFGMGIQTATAIRLAVPDMTTTVLTRMLSSLVADLRPTRPALLLAGRRVLAVVAMLVGAICGALLVLRIDATAALALATGVLVLLTLASSVVEEEG